MGYSPIAPYPGDDLKDHQETFIVCSTLLTQIKEFSDETRLNIPDKIEAAMEVFTNYLDKEADIAQRKGEEAAKKIIKSWQKKSLKKEK